MKRLKQALAAMTAAAVMAASMAGCSATDYAMTANDEKINAGVYINYLLSEMTNQMYMMYYTGEVTDMSQCFDKEIDGKKFTDYVKDTAIDNMMEFAAINAKFNELGLSLSEEDANAVKDSVSAAWEQSGDLYEYEGISRESLTQYYELSYKRSAIFDYYYAEGGIEEVTDDALQTYVNENYIRYKTITVAKSPETDEEAKNAEDEENKALLEGYLERAESMSFEEFDELIDEYDAYLEEQSSGQSVIESEDDLTEDENVDDTEGAEDESAADTESEEDPDAETSNEDSEAADDDSQAETAGEDSETDSETDESSEAEDSAEDDSQAEDDSAEEDSAADEEPADDEASDGEDEEEDDPYANETVFNYTNNVNPDGDYYDETFAAMLTKFKNTEFGKATMYEDDENYYLYMTADIAERTDYVEDNHDSLLQIMKNDDFEALVDSWVEALNTVLNDKAIKRYTVKEVYDRQEEYYSKNQ